VPEANAGVCERLGGVIGGDADHRHAVGQGPEEKFLEHVVAPP
jgi:hypothetical protein